MSIHTKSLLVGASTLASVLAVQQASADTPLETVTEPVEKVQIPDSLPQGDPLPDIVENGLAPKLKGSQSILNKPTVTGSDLRNVRGDGSDLRKINVTGAVRGDIVFIRTEFASGMVMNGTGIVVGNNTILTVAHNFIDSDKTNQVFDGVVKMTITIGSNSEIHTNGKPDTTRANFHHTTSGTEITVNKEDFDFFNRDQYQAHVRTKGSGSGEKWKYDIAMIKLKTPFNAVAEKLNLGTGKALQLGDPLEWKKMHPDYQARTIGYPGNPGTGEEKLFRELPVKGMLYENTGQNISLISPDDRSAYFWQWPGTQIHGMSGGALVNPQNQLVGLVQFGTDGHDKDGGGLLFTDNYQNWIKQVLKKNSLTGFHTVDGKKYYYDENGNPVINDKKVIGDTEYTFNAYGSVTNERDVTAERLAREKAEAEAKAEQARKEAEVKAKAEEEARKAEEAKKAEVARKEAEAKAKAEEEARKAEEAKKAEVARKEAEAKAKAEEEARKAEEAKAEQARKEAEAKAKAEEEAKAEQARKEAEAKAKAEEEAKAEQARKEAEAKAKAEEEARKEAEAKAKAEEEAKAEQARKEAEAKAEQARKEAEAKAKAEEEAKAEQARKEAEAKAEQARKEAEAKAKAEEEAKAEQARKEAEAKAKAEEEAKAEQARKEAEAKAKAEAERQEAEAKAERQRQIDATNAQLEAKLQQQRQDAEAKERANREAEKAQKAVSDTQSEAPVVTPTQPVITADEAHVASDTAQQKWEAYRAQQAHEAQVRREYEAMKQQVPAVPTKVDALPTVNSTKSDTLNTAQSQASSERVNNLFADLHKTSNRIREQLDNTHAREVGRQYGNSVKSNLEGIRAGKSTEAVRQDLRQYLNQVADTLHTSRPDDKAIDEAVHQLEDEANRIHTTPKQETPSLPAQRIYTPNAQASNGATSNTQASSGAATSTQTSNGVTSTSGSTVSKNDTTIDTNTSGDTSPLSDSNTRSQVTTADTQAETAKKLPPTTSAKELPKTGDTSVMALFGLISLLGGYGVLPKKRS